MTNTICGCVLCDYHNEELVSLCIGIYVFTM